jgi:hypothetical protein
MAFYFDSIISSLGKTMAHEEQDHHIFLLGTGVNFVKKPGGAEEWYNRGETLSFAAQLTSFLRGEDIHTPNSSHSYQSDSVDVIDGADTLGTEVGQRIAKSLLLALDAAAKGKTTLNISGFSRGGVSAIILTHELERVRAALQHDLDNSSEKSLADIIAESNSVPGISLRKNPSYTREALQQLIGSQKKADNEEALKRTLLERLTQLEINLFVLDPVPGDKRFDTMLDQTAWDEPLFYTPLPRMVKKQKLFLQKHETSHCFVPIVPPGMNYEIIPGCHGTGDGNQRDHNNKDISPKISKKDVSGVQNLVLRNWLDFYLPPETTNPDEMNLNHPELEKITKEYLPASREQRNHQLLDNYKHILENMEAYTYLESVSYYGLGKKSEKRLVHFNNKYLTDIQTLDKHGDEELFLNLQHVKLWITQKLGASDFNNKSTLEQIVWLKSCIEKAFLPQEINLNDSSLSSDQDNFFYKLVQNENNHPLLKETLKALIKTVAGVYFRNHLNEEDSETCKQHIDDMFALLHKTDPANKKLYDLALSLMQDIPAEFTQVMLNEYQDPLFHLTYTHLHSSHLAKTDDEKRQWLITAENLINETALLCKNIGKVLEWCDFDILKQKWSGILPYAAINNKDDLWESMNRYIADQTQLFLDASSAIVKNTLAFLVEQPHGVSNEFYDEIYSRATREMNEENARILEEQVEEDKNEIRHLKQKIVRLHQKQNDVKAELREDLHTLNQDIQALIRETEDKVQKEYDALNHRLQAFQHPDEEPITVIIQNLLERTLAYRAHLFSSVDENSEIYQQKLRAVNGMLTILQDRTQLPSERLAKFQQTLVETRDTLKEHRDSGLKTFMRYVSDCFRVIGVGLAYVSLVPALTYRGVTGHRMTFFTESKGKEFTRDAEQLLPARRV